MKFSLAIPARYGSHRLPGKVLADLGGKPVLRYVWEAALAVRGADEVLVLSESELVLRAVESWGGRCLLTAESCSTGTERIASVLDRLSGDCIVNLQADEPFLEPATVEALMERALGDEPYDLLTPVYALRNGADLDDPSVVKVVRGHGGEALYFSRCPIPFVRDCPRDRWLEQNLHWGHMGVYLYRRSTLERLHSLPGSPLAGAESLEQLRFLQAGLRIGTVTVGHWALAIDTAADLARARQILAVGNQKKA
ncbi:MAG: 3-deoxy-manno-octulosonate cytidylyltransferase [Puniceicoccales bacterium]|nr:3-deoxy-manno-octulosonate cytidylyltransferase [Puniceicoccales bacterium]